MDKDIIIEISHYWSDSFRDGIGDITLDQIYELAISILDIETLEYEEDCISCWETTTTLHKKCLDDENIKIFSEYFYCDLTDIDKYEDLTELFHPAMDLINFCVRLEHKKAIKYLVLHPEFWELSKIGIEGILDIAEKEELLYELVPQFDNDRINSFTLKMISKFLIMKFAENKQDYNELKESYDQLKEDIKYIPGYGEEYLKAREHFIKEFPKKD